MACDQSYYLLLARQGSHFERSRHYRGENRPATCDNVPLLDFLETRGNKNRAGNALPVPPRTLYFRRLAQALCKLSLLINYPF